MSVKKYCDLETLQYYDSKWLLRFEAMEINNNDIDNLLLDNMGIVPTLPTSWTESANGTLDLSLSNAYSYWPEGAGTKTVSIANGTTSGLSKFFLKLTDAGNFPMQWGSNIQWKNGSEPEWQAFKEDIIYFRSSDGGNTWTAQVLQTTTITPYWKITIETKTANQQFTLPFDQEYIGNVNWGDGSTDTNVTINGYAPSEVYFLSHTYATAGIYKIKMMLPNGGGYLVTDDGDPADFMHTYIPHVISIDSPLPTLMGTYQWPSSYAYKETGDLYACFSHYNNLISIPEKLLWNNTFGNIQECFAYCSSLTSIPRGLFDRHTTTTNFARMFYMCESLEYIPSNLFLYNTEAWEFYECFYGCSKINDVEIQIGSTKVTSASGFFEKKEGVTRTIKVPSGSTTQTTFNNIASGYGLTIVGV